MDYNTITKQSHEWQQITQTNDFHYVSMEKAWEYKSDNIEHDILPNRNSVKQIWNQISHIYNSWQCISNVNQIFVFPTEEEHLKKYAVPGIGDIIIS